jgi:hypothetical protein
VQKEHEICGDEISRVTGRGDFTRHIPSKEERNRTCLLKEITIKGKIEVIRLYGGTSCTTALVLKIIDIKHNIPVG